MSPSPLRHERSHVSSLASRKLKGYRSGAYFWMSILQKNSDFWHQEKWAKKRSQKILTGGIVPNSSVKLLLASSRWNSLKTKNGFSSFLWPIFLRNFCPTPRASQHSIFKLSNLALEVGQVWLARFAKVSVKPPVKGADFRFGLYTAFKNINWN